MIHYGMSTDNGNRVVDGVVIAAKQLHWTLTEVTEIMDMISTVRGLHEAGNTGVRESVNAAIFK